MIRYTHPFTTDFHVVCSIPNSHTFDDLQDESEMGDVFNEASTPPSHSSRTIVPNSSTDSYGEYPNFNGEFVCSVFSNLILNVT